MKKAKFGSAPAAVFGEADRPTETVTLDALSNEGEELELYLIKPGEIVTFPPTEDTMFVRKQPVRKGSTSKMTLIRCVRQADADSDPKESWFNLGHVNKTNSDGVYVHPDLHGLGSNNKDRAKALVGKKLTGISEEPITVFAYKADGSREFVIGEDLVRRPALKESKVVKIVLGDADYAK